MLGLSGGESPSDSSSTGYVSRARAVLSGFRSPREFLDPNRISRPSGATEAAQRVTYNTRHFAGNYLAIVLVLGLYGMITSPQLIIAVSILVGGFWAINKFAPEPLQVGQHVVTQRSLYAVLLVVGIPLLWWASPFILVFWFIGSSALLVLGHAVFVEPPVSSEYAAVETV